MFAFLPRTQLGTKLSQQRNATTVYNFMSGVLPAGVTVLRNSSANYFSSGGQLVTSAPNEARFDYDPVSLTLRGLLVEPEATNIISESHASTAYWTEDQCTISNLALSALGQFDGLEIDSGAKAWSRARISMDVAMDPQVALTVYYRLGSSGALRFRINSGAQVTQFQGVPNAYNVSRTDLGSPSAITDDLLADGLTRKLRFVLTLPSTGPYTIGLGANSSVSGETIVFLGMQVEEGAIDTSLITTQGSSALRAADQLTFNALAGTYDFETTYADGTTSQTGPVLVAPGYVLPVTQGHIQSVAATLV